MAKIEQQTVSVNEISRISLGTTVKGEISSPNDIRIDGVFEGKIVSKGRVVVGDKASITGDIICDNVDFWGKMNGNFFVKDTLTLKQGCTVDGNLRIRRLVVELGAKFNGNCSMLSDGEFDKVAGTAKPAPAPAK